MTYLEVQLPAQPVITADDDRVATVDYAHVTAASALATKAAQAMGATPREQMLADAVHGLVDVLTEIVSGLHHGRLTVVNYPAEGSHLD